MGCKTISASGPVVVHSTRSVVAVSADAQRAELLDALLAHDTDYDVIFVESIARAYSRIKQVNPEAVIVLCEIDDADACHLLSMLKIDAELANVLVLTCAIRRVDRDVVGIVSKVLEQPQGLGYAIQMN